MGTKKQWNSKKGGLVFLFLFFDCSAIKPTKPFHCKKKRRRYTHKKIHIEYNKKIEKIKR
ncbi:hypothetical protein V6Z11_A01G056300 [Gossypium hirsutum]